MCPSLAPMRRAILISGPAGSGKTTRARAFEALGYVRLSFDEIAWQAGYREHPLPAAARAEVHQRIQADLVREIRAGRKVVVDTSFWSRQLRDEYRALLAPLDVVPVVHYMKVPAPVLRQRLARRQNSDFDDIAVPEERLQTYLDTFEAPTPEEGPLRVIVPS